MRKKKNNNLRYFFIIGFLFVLYHLTFAQTPVRVMRIHFADGAVSDVPVALVDGITFDYNVGNNLEPIVTDSISSNEVLQRAYLMASA